MPPSIAALRGNFKALRRRTSPRRVTTLHPSRAYTSQLKGVQTGGCILDKDVCVCVLEYQVANNPQTRTLY